MVLRLTPCLELEGVLNCKLLARHSSNQIELLRRVSSYQVECEIRNEGIIIVRFFASIERKKSDNFNCPVLKGV